MSREHESNRIAWNEAAAFYRAEIEPDIEFIRKGGMTFCPPELKHLKLLIEKSETGIHLQCAAGTDTLSLLNLGIKEVIGVDISDEMIRLAQMKSDTLKMNARWVESDVLKVPAELNGTADLIYTGKGAIPWIMNLSEWARVIARLLKPGGTLYLFEGHPITCLFDMKATELKMDPIYKGYFSQDLYESQDWPETYVGKVKESEKDQALKYERVWPVSEVINSLLSAGLVLQKFEEHPDSYWQEFPNLPDHLRSYFPNTYSLVVTKHTGSSS